MAIRIRITQTRPRRQVFTHEIGIGKPAFSSLAFSVLIHGLAFAGLAAMPRSAPPPPDVVKRPALLPTEIRIDDHLYYVAELTPDETTAEETQEDQASPAQTAASQAAAVKKRRARKKNTATAAKPGEVLPPLAATGLRGPSATQVLIQPGLPPDLTTPATTLPTFRVWTDQTPLVRKAFVTPGRQNPAPPGSPPQLDPPDLDLVHADPAPAQNEAKLVLPRPPSPLEPTPNARAGPQPIPVGDPVNVLSVSERPKAANERLVVPPVQMGANGVDNVQPGVRGQGGGPGGAGRAPVTQTPSQTAANVNPAVNPPVNPAVNPPVKSPAPNPTNPPAPNGAPPVPSSPNAPPVAQPGVTQPGVTQPGVNQPGVTQPGTRVPAVVGPRPPSSQPEGTARIEMPRNGNYEVVVTQNAGVIPGSADFLRGRPVYSVYLHAGDKKDWILQYCLPASDEAPRKNSVVIRLGDAAPVGGPYAVVMLRPAVTFAAPDIRYAMVHGFINTDGHFEQLNEVGDRALRNMPELLQALAGWEFRPATKDGVPIMVEVLLCIPNIRT